MNKFVKWFALALILSIVGLYIADQYPSRTSKVNTSIPLAQGVSFLDTDPRAYPGKTLPKEGFYAGFEAKQHEILKLGKTNTLDSDSWESIGPFNIGGRTLALALDPTDPNIVYAGSASGGLWRLTILSDGSEGYSWERIETGYPVLGVGAIAIDPNDRNTIYIGTGEVYRYQGEDGATFASSWMRIRGNYGIGLLKSTDGGVSWTKSIDWTKNQQRGIQDIIIDPQNSQNVYAATTEGVYKSSDSGDTWELVLPEIMVVDLAINPDNTNIIFASVGNYRTEGVGIYRSQDGGTNWTRLTTGLPGYWYGKTLLDIYQADPNIIYADIANSRKRMGLFKSVDGGDTWDKVSDLVRADVSINQGYYSHFVRVNPEDNNKLFAAKVNYAFSEDAGNTWTIPFEDIYDFLGENSTQAHADVHVFANHPDDSDTFYIGTDGGVYITTDGGRNFKSFKYGYVTTQFYPGFASSSTNPNLAIGGMQDNGTALYIGDKNWDDWVWAGDGGYNAIDDYNNNTIYFSSQFLNIVKTEVGFGDEDNYTYSTPYNIYSTFGVRHEDEFSVFIAPFVLAASDFLYAATNYVYRTMDGGENWKTTNANKPLNGFPVVTMAVPKINPDVVFAATAPYHRYEIRPAVFHTRNRGDFWMDITYNLPDRYIVDLTVNPKRDDVVYAALSGFGTPHIYKLILNERTWKALGEGTDGSGGMGLPDVPISTIVIDPDDVSKIYIGNDLGVWASANGGVDWLPYSNGFPEAVLVRDLSISESNRMLRAATHGNGVYEKKMLLPEWIDEEAGIVTDFVLKQNYPNPFNPETTIPFTLTNESEVEIKIYSITGELVKTYPTRTFRYGYNFVKWKGLSNSGKSVASGVYIYSVRAGNQPPQVKRMTFIK